MDLKTCRKEAGLTVKQVLQDYPDKRLDKHLYSKIESGIVPAPDKLKKHVLTLCMRSGSQIPTEEDRRGDRSVATPEMLLQYIPTDSKNGITRQELVEITGVSDRIVRQRIEVLRRDYPIINHQNGRGYFVSHDPAELRSYYKQERNRALSILYRLKPIRKILKGAEK
ncbi:MAG TPA: hypothetical protein DEA44_16870 [Firmicutes bacterium]|nr:hypothetical protein [Bacillota bacterium]